MQRRAGRRSPSSRGGLPPWLLLLVLGFLAAATVLPLRSLDEPAKDPQAEAAPDRPSAAGSAGKLLGTRVAPLLPAPKEGLKAFVGRPAFGRGVVVQAINGNEGFWVGTSEKDRVYVEWGGDVGRNEPSRFQPTQGQRVSLLGPVRRPPPDPAKTLRLNAPEAQEVRDRGGYINADVVRAK